MAPSSPLTAAGLPVTRGIGKRHRCQVPGVGCQVPMLQTMRRSTRKSLVRGLACMKSVQMAAECFRDLP